MSTNTFFFFLKKNRQSYNNVKNNIRFYIIHSHRNLIIVHINKRLYLKILHVKKEKEKLHKIKTIFLNILIRKAITVLFYSTINSLMRLTYKSSQILQYCFSILRFLRLSK